MNVENQVFDPTGGFNDAFDDRLDIFRLLVLNGESDGEGAHTGAFHIFCDL